MNKNKDRQINLERDLTLLIEIAKQGKEQGTITLSYVRYLEDHLRLYKRGRQEKEAEMLKEFEGFLLGLLIENKEEGYASVLDMIKQKSYSL